MGLDRFISKNKNITWEIINDNPFAFPKRKWKWFYISQNPNLTWEIIKNNPQEKWAWKKITENSMKYGKKKWIDELRLKIIKALQIQRHWRNCSNNPEYKLAQKIIGERLNCS